MGHEPSDLVESLYNPQGRYAKKLQRFEDDYARLGELAWAKQPLSTFASSFASELQVRFGACPRILDLGSGLGIRTVGLAGLGLRPVGIEQSVSALGQSRALARQSAVLRHPVHFVRGDIRHLPFRARSFDGFHDYFSLMHLHPDDWPSYFEELGRVVGVGGLGTIVCFSASDEEFFGIPIRAGNVGWLKFQSGYAFCETHDGQSFSELHDYPRQWESYSWYFASEGDIQRHTATLFSLRGMELVDYTGGTNEHRSKRHYWDLFLERR